mmetsp:Transcript_53898/g.122846  ORF Transcript_53898/g.122846 Transcript_53898/m.122846 type:complete len:138 (-) Transcript_53898:688-1101(-)
MSLPPNWFEYKTPEGQAYFYNSETKVTSWESPCGLPPAAPVANSAPAVATASPAAVLPQGQSQGFIHGHPPNALLAEIAKGKKLKKAGGTAAGAESSARGSSSGGGGVGVVGGGGGGGFSLMDQLKVMSSLPFSFPR